MFSVFSCPEGPDRRYFELSFHEDCSNAELRLRVDENVDETCDPQRRDRVTAVLLNNTVINGMRAFPTLRCDATATTASLALS